MACFLPTANSFLTLWQRILGIKSSNICFPVPISSKSSTEIAMVGRGSVIDSFSQSEKECLKTRDFAKNHFKKNS